MTLRAWCWKNTVEVTNNMPATIAGKCRLGKMPNAAATPNMIIIAAHAPSTITPMPL